jgi:hypothetical protein
MSIDVSRVKTYKPALPTKGKGLVELLELKEIEGKEPDKNGEKSKGLACTVKIVGPDSVILTTGDSALGYKVTKNFWLPRMGLRERDIKTADRMDKAVNRLLVALYGSAEAMPDVIDADEYKSLEGRQFIVTLGSEWSDFDDDNVATFKDPQPYTGEEEGL